MSGIGVAGSRLQGLQRENWGLQEQLRSSEQLNATLRCELDLHCSIMAQNSSHHQEQDHSHEQKGSQTDAKKLDGDIGPQRNAPAQAHTMSSGSYVILVG